VIELSWPSPLPDDAEVESAVERNDPAEMLRWIDGCCSDRAWARLAELRDRCLAAGERGRQLGGVAAHAEYRLALEAPPEWAAVVCRDGLGRFTPGPVHEVAASTHSWAELEPHLAGGTDSSLVAHERVVRGEDLTHVTQTAPASELPLRLGLWEPDWAVPTFRPDGVVDPAPALPKQWTELELDPTSIDVQPDADADDALARLVTAWTTESEGSLRSVSVDGSAAEALYALDPGKTIRLAEVSAAAALAQIGWAAAGGGAHGRRRGAAAGRAATWWLAATLAGMADDWPLDPDALGEAVRSMRWFVWDRDEPDHGWNLRVAVEDPLDGLAWAWEATDHAENPRRQAQRHET